MRMTRRYVIQVYCDNPAINPGFLEPCEEGLRLLESSRQFSTKKEALAAKSKLNFETVLWSVELDEKETIIAMVRLPVGLGVQR
jgi:hypothetical protein